MNEREYDFSNHGEILDAIDKLYEADKEPSSEKKTPLMSAIKQFLETRANSELIDLPDLEPSIWDYEDLTRLFRKEFSKRSIPETDLMNDLLNDWHKEWAGRDSPRERFTNMEKQVNGIQEKVDKITKLLENFEIKMSVADALKL